MTDEILQKMLARMQQHPDLIQLLRSLPADQKGPDARRWASMILATILYEETITAPRRELGQSLICYARELAAVRNPFNKNSDPQDPALKQLLLTYERAGSYAEQSFCDPERQKALQNLFNVLMQQFLKYQNWSSYLSGRLTADPCQALNLDLKKKSARKQAVGMIRKRGAAIREAAGAGSYVTQALSCGSAAYAGALPLHALDTSLKDGAAAVLADVADPAHSGETLETISALTAPFVGEALFCILAQQYAARSGPCVSVSELDAEDLMNIHRHCIQARLVTGDNQYAGASPLYKALVWLSDLPNASRPMSPDTLQEDLKEAGSFPRSAWLVFFSRQENAQNFQPDQVEIVSEMPNLSSTDGSLRFQAIGSHRLGACERRYRIRRENPRVELWENRNGYSTWFPYTGGARFLRIDQDLLDRILQ